MKCWSCAKDISDDAKFCPHCEAQAEPEPTEEEKAVVAEILGTFSPELMGEIQQAFKASGSGEEFVNRIMVGDCPQCGSASTGDCENDPELEDPCIGRCFDCGQLWCLDCGEYFSAKPSIQHDCPMWDDEDWDS